ncbi:MAG: Large-conductance mechanosensitive channel MscMJLR [Methanonatronarchaeales archaeon]|nr:Large-conductance mechanosensitive channel MscMJLR [Methanonatronarchaeales archaeon]
MVLRLFRVGVTLVAATVAFGFAGYGSILTSLAAVAAAVTLAVGFAAQEMIKNLVSGVFIHFEKPFKVGDWIEWEDNVGTVEDISLRVTRVAIFDNELLTVPNSRLTDDVIKNPVAKGRLRIRTSFGIGYDDDIDLAKEIILETARGNEEIREHPVPTVHLRELADNYINLQARFWVTNPKRTDFIRIKSDYVQEVKERFDEVGISLPAPQRELSGSIDVNRPEEAPG